MSSDAYLKSLKLESLTKEELSLMEYIIDTNNILVKEKLNTVKGMYKNDKIAEDDYIKAIKIFENMVTRKAKYRKRINELHTNKTNIKNNIRTR